MFEDLKPKKINLTEWSHQFRKISDQIIKKYKYYGNQDWGIYLSPLATFMVYGARQLKRLKFDNSFAALRLWGFVFNESERLFRAKQVGKKVIATMGDLGTIPVIVMSFPDCIPFYPECIWWTPFFNESFILLDMATKLGAPEPACFSRAALAAFYKKAYFPKPDLIFASTGASCDDYSCIMQLIEGLGYNPIWIEIPFRRKSRSYFVADDYEHTKWGIDYPKRFETYLMSEYEKVWQNMVEFTDINNRNYLAKSIKNANRLRKLVENIKKLSYEAELAPFPGLELMVIEFGNLYGYADFDEWTDIIEMVYETISERVQKGEGVLNPDALPIAWVTPSPDPYLLNLVEDLGCRIVATEYVINQALVEIEEDIEPFQALARSFLNASLIGSTEQRVRRIIEGVEHGRILGVLITNMLGCSHCAMETRLIQQMLSKVPVLSIDVPAPFGITEQLKSRIAAFVETIRCARR
ncbi:MAG: 2-hydroxyacyl-CoA dehydratase [Candidatus Stahlbacteria bacterium]|nr:MAG: 2-hydroxyacyl-CoA dehydratase [Candidatus Stahlbacteria bacterium]